MQPKIEITKTERSANFKSMLLVALFGMVFFGLMATQASAFEIITKEDIVQKPL